MKLAGILVCALLSLALVVRAEEAPAESSATRPPTRIPVSGFLQTVTGEPRNGEVTLVLSIYADRESAEPLWSEEQTIVLRQDGRYDVALGGASPEGLPGELFAANGARWVGIGERGGLEQPRFMLVSVPYATKALDADAVGGRRAKEFVLAEELEDRVASVLAGGRAPDPVAQGGMHVTQDPTPVNRGRSFTLDLTPRSEADAPVAAAGRFTNEATTGEMYGVHAHVHSTSGGAIDSGATGVYGEVTPASPGGYSAGVRGVNRGTGSLGIGVVGFQNGYGWGVHGFTPSGIGVFGNSTDGIGVYGASSGPAAGVLASHEANPSFGPALDIRGSIKVSGSHRAAFLHTATGEGWWSTVDHPLINGRPDALLLVTQRAYMGSLLGSPAPMCCRLDSFGVLYVPELGKWLIVNGGGAAADPIPAGTEFNVLVIHQ